MAHLFKPATKDTKGIIVWTHKELDRFLKKVDLPWEHLTRNYFMGTHYGGVQPKVRKRWVHESFIMGSETAVKFSNAVFRIPYLARNFTPEFFKPTGEARDIDILCVSRGHKVKRLPVLLGAIRRLYDQHNDVRAVFIVPGKTSPDKNYDDIVSLWHRLFTRDEQQACRLILPRTDSFRGMLQEELVRSYQRARVFALPSIREGSPKVLSEALLCGCQVVVDVRLMGGGVDYLNGANSTTFGNHRPVETALLLALSKSLVNKPDTESIAEEVRVDHTLPKLANLLHLLYREHGQVFDGNLINTDHLNFRLNGHWHDVPWYEGNPMLPADIKSKDQFETFIKYVKEHEDV